MAHGRKLKLNHPGDAIAAGLVLVPANRLQALLPQRSIRENVALPLVRNPRELGARFAAQRARARRRRRQAVADRHPRRIRTAPAERRQSAEGGDRAMGRRRAFKPCFASIRRAASTSAPSIRSTRSLRELADAGSSVLLFTSELPEIRLVCDRAIVLFGGRNRR